MYIHITTLSSSCILRWAIAFNSSHPFNLMNVSSEQLPKKSSIVLQPHTAHPPHLALHSPCSLQNMADASTVYSNECYFHALVFQSQSIINFLCIFSQFVYRHEPDSKQGMDTLKSGLYVTSSSEYCVLMLTSTR
jgi:hypothetical protein